MPVELQELDGRRFRREQNRDAVLDTLIELFRDGNYLPTVNEIAGRAGISARSLFRYFDDLNDLTRSAIARHMASAGPLYDVGVSPDLPTDAKIDLFVDARVRLFEVIAPTARAVRVAVTRNPMLASQLRERRSFFRRQISEVFAAELGAADEHGEHSPLLPALDTLCSFETYDLLRSDHGLSLAKTKASLVEALSRLLHP
jgi:AcrR family transcriptional regulator